MIEEIEFCKWTSLTWEDIHNLPIDKFNILAKMQSTLFPDLLKIIDEEEIIDTFYREYKRERLN
jgi:hypothetical protein